eukprot:TRINITY_DN4127_c0_g1_i2.p1 TRINITY_DN4127_c0_g1~~TRINITY_DN4127_c0_g1_i2.p1  ORF type:complete len:146 (+),score=40.61 TRINITY_DN4127_c0_g1_i2:152-589(+)
MMVIMKLAECFSLFGAGNDSTASTAQRLIDILMQHPHVQTKIRNEIRSLLEKHGDDWIPTYEDLTEMQYIDNVLKEVTRLYPFVGILSAREAVKDIKINQLEIPKGVENIFIYLMKNNNNNNNNNNDNKKNVNVYLCFLCRLGYS